MRAEFEGAFQRSDLPVALAVALVIFGEHAERDPVEVGTTVEPVGGLALEFAVGSALDDADQRVLAEFRRGPEAAQQARARLAVAAIVERVADLLQLADMLLAKRLPDERLDADRIVGEPLVATSRVLARTARSKCAQNNPGSAATAASNACSARL